MILATRSYDPKKNRPHLSNAYLIIAKEAKRGRYRTEEDLRRKIRELVGDEALLERTGIKGHYVLFTPYDGVVEHEEISYDREPYEDNLVFEVVDGVFRLTESCEESIFGPPESHENKKLRKKLESHGKKLRDLEATVKGLSEAAKH